MMLLINDCLIECREFRSLKRKGMSRLGPPVTSMHGMVVKPSGGVFDI